MQIMISAVSANIQRRSGSSIFGAMQRHSGVPRELGTRGRCEDAELRVPRPVTLPTLRLRSRPGLANRHSHATLRGISHWYLFAHGFFGAISAWTIVASLLN